LLLDIMASFRKHRAGAGEHAPDCQRHLAPLRPT